MALKERNQQMALAAELLYVHIPAVLETDDQDLAHDVLCAFLMALRAAYAEVEAAAAEWENREYQEKADILRREWRWVDDAADYLETLLKSPNPLDGRNVQRVTWLIPIELTPAARHKISDPEKLRGTCKAYRAARKTATKRAK